MELRVSLRKIGVFVLFLAASAAQAGELPKDSLYQLKAGWLGADGKVIKLEDTLLGHPVVATMAYTKCTYTCPMIVAKLKKIEKEAGKHPDLRILIISFDQKNETPETMRAFMEEKGLDPARWVMVTGQTSGAVREMAALLEINYKEEASGHFSHSNVIALLDKNGVKKLSLNGIAADHSGLVKQAKKEL